MRRFYCPLLATLAVHLCAPAQSQWTSGQLSQYRIHIAAMSVGPFALFAGGSDYLVYLPHFEFYDTVDLYDDRSGSWTVAALSDPRGERSRDERRLAGADRRRPQRPGILGHGRPLR